MVAYRNGPVMKGPNRYGTGAIKMFPWMTYGELDKYRALLKEGKDEEAEEFLRSIGYTRG